LQIAKAREQFRARPGSLHEQRKADAPLQQLVRAAQGAQRGEEQERAPAARLEHRQRSVDHRLGERRVVRVGRQPARQVEQRLARVVERRSDEELGGALVEAEHAAKTVPNDPERAWQLWKHRIATRAAGAPR